MNKVEQQEEFILQWCKTHCGFDALNSDFHDSFHNKFGGKRHECNWGAQTVYKAMKIAKKMYDKGLLKRGTIGLGGNWQPGFPKWVWVYSLNQEKNKCLRRER